MRWGATINRPALLSETGSARGSMEIPSLSNASFIAAMIDSLVSGPRWSPLHRSDVP